MGTLRPEQAEPRQLCGGVAWLLQDVSGAMKASQVLKCLSCKHEDLSSDPPTPTYEPRTAVLNSEGIPQQRTQQDLSSDPQTPT